MPEHVSNMRAEFPVRWTRWNAGTNLPAQTACGLNVQSVTVSGHEIGLPPRIHVSRAQLLKPLGRMRPFQWSGAI
jgi:hypothetical protein